MPLNYTEICIVNNFQLDLKHLDMKFAKIGTVLVLLCLGVSTISAQQKLKITINDETILTATLMDNSSTKALIELLKENPITISMSDYANMEKVGDLGTTLPRNDEQINAEPGDLILYQGSALVIYYAPNSWNFTRLGKIDNVNQQELKAILGDGAVTVKLELYDITSGSNTLNNTENLYTIYPNPVIDSFQVNGAYENLSLFNSKGEVLFTSRQRNMNIQSLPSGMYFLKIEKLNKNIAFQKILKL